MFQPAGGVVYCAVVQAPMPEAENAEACEPEALRFSTRSIEPKKKVWSLMMGPPKDPMKYLR